MCQTFRLLSIDTFLQFFESFQYSSLLEIFFDESVLLFDRCRRNRPSLDCGDCAARRHRRESDRFCCFAQSLFLGRQNKNFKIKDLVFK